MKKLQIALCDTNRQELASYERICRDICEQNSISVRFKYYSTIDELLFDMEDDEFLASVDIFVVDPENGFDTIPSLIRKKGYDGMIIYLSHSKSLEHYRQAFDVGAKTFIDKDNVPQNLSRFRSVFNLAIQTLRQIDRQYFVASYAGEHKRIEIKDILYFETAADHMINIVYKGGSFKFLSTIKSLEERFGSRGFVRTHRSYLVSVSAINRVDFDSIALNNGYSIPVSRERYPFVKTAMLR